VLDEYLTGQRAHHVDGHEEPHAYESHVPEPLPDLLTVAAVVAMEVPPTASARQAALRTSELCPECGEASMVNEEGCRKCYSCGYSEC
jgi:hypothetical protein